MDQEMLITDVDPKKATVIVEFADGKVYTYSLTDLLETDGVPVLAAAMGFVTLELKRAETELKKWEAEQFFALREEKPSIDGKKPKRLSEKDALAALKTSDGYTRMRGAVGRAAGAANMLEVMASMVSAGGFKRRDRNFAIGDGHS